MKNSPRAPRPARHQSPGPAGSLPSLRELKQQERTLILEALEQTGGRIYGPDGAAARLGLKPTTLSSKVHRLGLRKTVG